MLDDKRIQIVLLAGGLALAAIALLIDPIRGYVFYLHPLQIAALVIGILLFLAGAYATFIRQPPPAP